MNEPKFISKEELDRRREIIDGDKMKLELIKDHRNVLKSRLANINSDLIVIPSDRLRKDRDNLTDELRVTEDDMNFYISDIAQSEKILKKDKKDYNEYNKWQHLQYLQNLTLPTAYRQNEVYTKEDLIEICSCDYEDDNIVATAIKLQRTYYGVEHFVRAKEYFIKYRKLSKENDGCAYSNLLLKVFEEELR